MGNTCFYNIREREGEKSRVYFFKVQNVKLVQEMCGGKKKKIRREKKMGMKHEDKKTLKQNTSSVMLASVL